MVGRPVVGLNAGRVATGGGGSGAPRIAPAVREPRQEPAGDARRPGRRHPTRLLASPRPVVTRIRRPDRHPTRSRTASIRLMARSTGAQPPPSARSAALGRPISARFDPARPASARLRPSRRPRPAPRRPGAPSDRPGQIDQGPPAPTPATPGQFPPARCARGPTRRTPRRENELALRRAREVS